MFIDKYTQIYRILLPICNSLAQIPALATKPALRSYIENEYGSVENCIKDILGDFFKHGFDGSRADNFFDAGSCIDGRLTSAWNWCASLEKKRYFPVFLLTGMLQLLLRVQRLYVLLVRIIARSGSDLKVLLNVRHPEKPLRLPTLAEIIARTHMCLSTSKVLVCWVKLLDLTTRLVFASFSSSSL